MDFIETAQNIVESKKITNNILVVAYNGFINKHSGIDEIINFLIILKRKGKR